MSIEKEGKPMYWETLKIESRSQTIIINRYEEYGVRDTCDFEEVKINEFVIEYKPINRGQEYFNISQ
jgi:phage anti-repressor protein